MSAGAAIVAAFIDGYTSDLTKMGQDSNDDIWVLDIPNLRMRDELAFLFARLETDTLYRDRVAGKAMEETDQVTPDLLLATSKRLLGISKREQEPDPKDSLAFQRFYGPEMLFSEHILRDNGKLGRNILWKATNRGNLELLTIWKV